MTKLCASAVLWCVLALPAFPQERSGRARTWLRRLTVAAACAASFWDMGSTRAAIASGARERNGLFSDRYGRPQWGRMAGVKAGICGGTAVIQELGLFGRSRTADSAWIVTNSGMAAVYSAVAIRNYRLAGDLRRSGP